MEAIQKRIRTLNEELEKLDQVDRIVLLDVGGHVILDLMTDEVRKIKASINDLFEKELENHRSTQRMVLWTSQALKEGIVQ